MSFIPGEATNDGVGAGSGGGVAGVSSLDGLTGDITQSVVGGAGSYANVGNDVQLTINFPAPPPTTIDSGYTITTMSQPPNTGQDGWPFYEIVLLTNGIGCPPDGDYQWNITWANTNGEINSSNADSIGYLIGNGLLTLSGGVPTATGSLQYFVGPFPGVTNMGNLYLKTREDNNALCMRTTNNNNGGLMSGYYIFTWSPLTTFQ